MPTAVTELPPVSEPRRKVWTRAEVDALTSIGLFDQQKFELVEGELINTMGKRPAHVASLLFLRDWLAAIFGLPFVRHESPINVAPEDNAINEPEPDVILAKHENSHFIREHPKPEDIRLLVEISDSTLSFDLRNKAALYARAGIVEYWVLDIRGRRIFVHREPAEGRYASVAVYNFNENVAPLCAPESRLLVGDAFPE
jgi:Uma2 family endonuclease